MDCYVYTAYGNIYINLTNKCDNSCTFCIRNGREGIEGQRLWIKNEPSAEDIIKQLPSDLSSFGEAVFCGFGEPTYRLDVVTEVANRFRQLGIKTRINTNGHSDLINGKPTAAFLARAIDTINVSLNASTKQAYDAICQSVYPNAFEAMLKFARDVRDADGDVVLSVVDVIGEEEIAACQALADQNGLRLRVRNYE